MNRQPNWRGLLSVLLVYAISFSPMVRHTRAAPQQSAGGQGGVNQDDPCTHLPDPSGKANGIDKQCPALGSSNGIAKGDFNGDGYADLAIGEPGATIDGQGGAGDVIILPGSANGLTTNWRLWYEGRVPGTGTPASGDGFGTALASGDFNGDGYSDLAIGIPGRDVVFQGNTYHSWGRVAVLYGSPNGLTTDHSTVFDLSQHYFLRDGHAKEGALLGQALSWGDFNGDGAGDLAIGAPHYTLDRGLFNNQLPEAGAVWVINGTKKNSTTFGGLSTAVPNLLFQADDIAGVIQWFDGSGSGDHFGASLASGDFDGDTHFDLAIGAPDKNGQSCFLCLPELPVPLVYVLAGTSVGIAATLRGEFQVHGLGPLAAGDFNGDGKTDLAFSVPSDLDSVGGSVFVVFGQNAPEILDSSFQKWDQHALGGVNQAGDNFGGALAVGDFNGDGKADLAIGVPFKDLVISGLTFVNAGEVNVIYGSSTGLSLAHPPQRWNRTNAFTKEGANIHAGDRFGAPLTAWNFGHDETITVINPFTGGTFLATLRTADLAIGAPFESVNGVSGAGAAHVMYGSVSLNGLHGMDSKGITDSQFLSADNIGLTGHAGAHFGAGIY